MVFCHKNEELISAWYAFALPRFCIFLQKSKAYCLNNVKIQHTIEKDVGMCNIEFEGIKRLNNFILTFFRK
jgi:hypothetical protein